MIFQLGHVMEERFRLLLPLDQASGDIRDQVERLQTSVSTYHTVRQYSTILWVQEQKESQSFKISDFHKICSVLFSIIFDMAAVTSTEFCVVCSALCGVNNTAACSSSSRPCLVALLWSVWLQRLGEQHPWFLPVQTGCRGMSDSQLHSE